MPFTIIRSDITKMPVDAIVNAANTNLAVGGGVCGAISKEAGAGELSAACAKLAPIKTGEAVITPGFALPAKYIIHTAGPVYHGGGKGEEALLRACYINALELAAKHGCESVAFPLISGGIYGYPKADALRVATGAIGDFLTDHHMDVALVVLDKEAVAVDAPLLGAVADYIDAHYVREHMEKSFEAHRLLDEAPAVVFSEVTVPGLEDIVGRLDEPFSATLLRLIDKSGKTDADIYKRANIDRRLFSKIRSNPHYAPSKPTALAFAVALELTLDQTGDLLERAGFALSHSRKLDVIVEYFIGAGRYDIFEINEVLFHYDQALLGG